METKKYQIGKFEFDNELDYKNAMHDLKLIKTIKEKQDISNPQIAKQILDLLKQGKLTLNSRFGDTFKKSLEQTVSGTESLPKPEKKNTPKTSTSVKSEQKTKKSNTRNTNSTKNVKATKKSKPLGKKQKLAIWGVLVLAVAAFFIIRHIKNNTKINTKGYDEYQVLEMYMNACIKKCDSKLAYRYTDTSYYKNYVGQYDKDYIESFEKELNKYQKEIINKVKNLKKIYGDFYYEITETDAYTDSERVRWNDIYIKIYYFDSYGVKNGESYRISLREYPDTGWKVTWVSNKT